MPLIPGGNEQINRAIVTRFSQLPECVFCGASNWLPLDDLVMFRTAGSIIDSQASSTGWGLPCVALICTNCGQTQFLSALALGLGWMEPAQPETE